MNTKLVLLEKRIDKLERAIYNNEALANELFGFGKKFGYKESEKFVKDFFRDGALSSLVKANLYDYRKGRDEFYVTLEFLDKKKYRGNFLISGDGKKNMYCGYYIDGGNAIKIMRNIDPLKDITKIKKFVAEIANSIAKK